MLTIYYIQDNSSPLHIAVEKGWTEVIKILITHGANVDALDWVRNTLQKYLSTTHTLGSHHLK